MSFIERAIEFVQKGEKLVIVTLTIVLGGLAAAIAEWQGLAKFDALPEWVRPAAILLWIGSAAHVSIHGLIATARGMAKGAGRLRELPRRRRQAQYDDALIGRLLRTGPVEREVICYALFKGENHFWLKDNDRRRNWLQRLKADGLVDVSKADFGTVHYKIHPRAWEYMCRYPTKFMNLIRWPDYPWYLADEIDNFEKQVLEQIEAAKTRK